jgi:hypothetical protein
MNSKSKDNQKNPRGARLCLYQFGEDPSKLDVLLKKLTEQS